MSERLMLSSEYAERVLTTLTIMPAGQSFQIDEGQTRDQFIAAVKEIIEKGLDRKRGFILEPNSRFTAVHKGLIESF